MKKTKKISAVQKNNKWKTLAIPGFCLGLVGAAMFVTLPLIVRQYSGDVPGGKDAREPEAANPVEISVTDITTSSSGTSFKVTSNSTLKIENIKITIGLTELTNSQYTFDANTGIGTIPASTLKQYSGNIKVYPQFLDETAVYLDYKTLDLYPNDEGGFTIPYVKTGDGKITWTSSDPHYVSVDEETGIITLGKSLVGGETVTITAHSATNTSECKITILTLPTDPEGKVIEIFTFEDVGIAGVDAWTVKANQANKASIKETLEIPSFHKGKPVVKVGSFASCTTIKKVILPNSITAINGLAFSGCTSLLEINIPKSVNSIGSNVFNSITTDYAVTFESSATWQSSKASSDPIDFATMTAAEICTWFKTNGIYTLSKYGIPDAKGELMFYFTSEITCAVAPKDKTATELTIPETVEDEAGNVYKVNEIQFDYSQKKSSFYGFTNLKVINLPKTIELIHENTFATCTSLTDINVDAGNKNYASYQGVLYSNDMSTLFRYPCAKETNRFIVPNFVKEITASSFANTSKLQAVIFDENSSLEKISIQAFYASSLTSINIPKSCTFIDYYAFLNCSKLTTLQFDDPINWYIHDAGGTTAADLATISKFTSYAGDECYFGVIKKSS